MKSKTIRLITVICAALGLALLAGCDTMPSGGSGGGYRDSGGSSGHHH